MGFRAEDFPELDGQRRCSTGATYGPRRARVAPETLPPPPPKPDVTPLKQPVFARASLSARLWDFLLAVAEQGLPLPPDRHIAEELTCSTRQVTDCLHYFARCGYATVWNGIQKNQWGARVIRMRLPCGDDHILRSVGAPLDIIV